MKWTPKSEAVPVTCAGTPVDARAGYYSSTVIADHAIKCLKEHAQKLGRRISSTDKAKLDEYLDSVRDVETSIERMRADKDKAADFVFQGDELREKGDHAGALAKYEAADKIMGVPTTGLEVAKTLMALGRLKEAQGKAKLCAEFPVKKDEPAAFTRARADASKMQVDLLERIPKVRILIKGGDDAKITVDGEPAASPTDLPARTTWRYRSCHSRTRR